MNFPSFGLPAYTLPFIEEGRSFPPGLGNFLSLQASLLPRGVQAAPWSGTGFGCCLSCAECRGLLEWASQQWRGSCLANDAVGFWHGLSKVQCTGCHIALTGSLSSFHKA